MELNLSLLCFRTQQVLLTFSGPCFVMELESPDWSVLNSQTPVKYATSAKWQVQFPSGWQDLPPEVFCKIEAARLRGENVAIYEQCRSKKKDWWDKYQINFSSMQQTNLHSGRMRKARRIVDEGKEESAAAPLMMEDQSKVAIDCAQLEGGWQEPEEDEPEDKSGKKHNKISDAVG